MSNNNDDIQQNNIQGQANAVPIDTVSQIRQKTIYKINSGLKFAIGFFCNIISDDLDPLKVFITNSHVFNEDDIKPGKKIGFSTNNDEQKYEIEIDNKRKIYASEIYDVTIIEMKREDKINPDSFFDIDKLIFTPDYNCENESIYLLHYQEGKQMFYSPGSIKNVDEKNYKIYLSYKSDHVSSGCPLINIKDYKVIGIQGASLKKK